MSKTLCPRCGKPLPNAEKLGWHLSRECPATVTTTATNDTPKSGSPTTHPTN